MAVVFVGDVLRFKTLGFTSKYFTAFVRLIQGPSIMFAKLSLALLASFSMAGVAQAQRTPTFEIRNGAGLCLDTHARDLNRNGGRVQVWECNGYRNQQWQFVNGTIRNGAGLCLETPRSQIRRNGGRVQVRRCNGRRQQRWDFAHGRIFNGGGLCLDTHAPDLNRNGARVQVWECNNYVQQQWRFLQVRGNRPTLRF